MKHALLGRLVQVRSVPAQVIVLAALASYGALILAVLQGLPLWARVLAMLLPWLPVFAGEMVWTYRHYGWLALFYVLVVTQVGHFFEHVAQVVQIHALGLKGANARGVFGALDIEWVHFLWNSWIILAVVALLASRFRRNPWLWATLAIAGWHELEHAYIMSVYLSTGKAGTPGLLAQGGAIAGGLPLSRPDLHFLYNLIETTPLLLAFAYQLRRTYDEWLAQAFPHLPEERLVDMTDRVQSVRFSAGETVVRQGDPADRMYIIVRGRVAIARQSVGDDGRPGREVEVGTLGPGQVFGEIGLLANTPRTASVRAATALELLAVDRETFRALLEHSEATAADLQELSRRRLSATSAVLMGDPAR